MSKLNDDDVPLVRRLRITFFGPEETVMFETHKDTCVKPQLANLAVNTPIKGSNHVFENKPDHSVSFGHRNYAHAASLLNRDSRSYDIHVKGTSTVNTSIASGTIKNNICSGFHTITVNGVDNIDVNGSERVVMKDGVLSN